MRRQFGEDRCYASAVAYMEKFPLFLERPEAIVAHGYMQPEIDLETQPENVITGTMSGGSYLKREFGRPWYGLRVGRCDFSKRCNWHRNCLVPVLLGTNRMLNGFCRAGV